MNVCECSWVSTFSARASSSVVRAVSVFEVSACRDLTRSFKLVICFSLSLSCSCRFSICTERKRQFYDIDLIQMKTYLLKHNKQHLLTLKLRVD